MMLCVDVAARIRFFCLSFFFLISVLMPPVSRAATGDLCSLPRIAEEGIDRFTTDDCFAVDLQSAGVFSLAAESFSSTEEEPVLTYLGFSSCDGEADLVDSPRLLFRTVASLAFEASGPGVHGFCLGSEERDGARADLRVVRRFAPSVGKPHGAEKDGDPDESEPDPKPLVGCGTDWAKDGDPDESEPDPKPLVGCGTDWTKDGDPDESEPDPKPFDGCGGLCAGRPWGDDHADLATCASSLGVLAEVCGVRQIDAEMRNLAGWDLDFFVFELESLSRLEILARSEVRLELALVDSAGHRLEVTDEAGSHGAAALEKVLPGGRYFLRVTAADGGEGFYSLRLGAVALDP